MDWLVADVGCAADVSLWAVRGKESVVVAGGRRWTFVAQNSVKRKDTSAWRGTPTNAGRVSYHLSTCRRCAGFD